MLGAIIPARNEAATVGAVVSGLAASRAYEPILVIDDRSTDATAAEVRAAGGYHIRTRSNLGKGQAMAWGIAQLPRDADIAFFDADLVDFTPAHARQLADLFAQGYDHVCGLRDFGILWLNALCLPIITGDRLVRRHAIDAVSPTCWDGYGIEMAINDAVDRVGGRTALVRMRGVTSRSKIAKVGLWKGLTGDFRTLAQVAAAKRALRRSGGRLCR